MAQEMLAFVLGPTLPTRMVWQAAIEQVGYPVRLWSELDSSTGSGFIPCAIDGQESGFELYLDTADALAPEYPHIASQIRDRPLAVSFRWRGDLKECACAMAAAAGLIQCSQAIVYYPDDDSWYGVERLRADFDACRSE